MKKWVPNLPANSFETNFCAYRLFFDFGIVNYIENPEFSARFRSKSSVERPNQTKSVIFSGFFTQKNRSKFPPVWPVPIETPQPSLQSLIPPYWPSTHPTCPILTWDISIHHTFLSGIASHYAKTIFVTPWYHPSL